MSEENNQKATANADGEKREHANRGGQNRRRRNRPSGAARQNAEQGEQSREKKDNRPRHEGAGNNGGQQQKSGNQKNASKKGGKGAQGNQKDRQKGNHSGRRGGHRHVSENRLYDPYEAPNKTEVELSELRARIVLQSADGTVPSALGINEPKEPTEQELNEAASAAAAILDAEQAAGKPEAQADTKKKVEVVGVRFRSSAKTYYFDPRGIHAKKGEFAIVETTRGPEFGEIRLANCMVNADDTVSPLRPLLRIATPADIAHNEENREKEKNALKVCQEKIRQYKLDMSLIDVQYAFDNSKLLFYFSSEGRVDFRDLVKDLASVFRTRIELRQIGIRDEAKMLGGLGACGRALCCSTFLPDFAQVSIKMAKDQSLSLNNTKISGVCGRLMCCLRYESDTYTEEIRKTPPHDSLVRTEDGVGVVIGSNPLAGTVRVLLKESPDTAPKQYHRDNVTVIGKEHRGEHKSKDGKDGKDAKEPKEGKGNKENKEPKTDDSSKKVFKNCKLSRKNRKIAQK